LIFTKSLTIPANTPENHPANTKIDVCYGLVYRVEIQFPAGCAGLVGFALFDGLHQVYPSSPGEWFITDNFTIAFDDRYLKLTEPFVFDLFGYNLDDTYPHTVYLRLGIVDKEEFMSYYMPTMTYQKLLQLLQEEKAKQEEEKDKILAEPYPWFKKK